MRLLSKPTHRFGHPIQEKLLCLILASMAEARRNQEIRHHAEALSSSLYPNQHLQEREVGGISYIAQFGPQLLGPLLESISPECAQHQVIPIT